MYSLKAQYIIQFSDMTLEDVSKVGGKMHH